ncbi:hypothetical protein [Desulfonema magnum]|uniref:Uncharacterized protein n=1 Tax=Desulfonema magnum TaxID=45655 RepID=A0A975BKH1_9BACT|nr:hypothetical protein [Desulfonema magnum]QTA87066.1 Uncharacterized protein dnm_030930 [Desulfonema magnum]
MRKKAEKEIRKAVSTLDSTDCHRIDRVRARTSLTRKVFDKTILDMARVGTIELISKNITEADDIEIGNFIRQGDTVHVSFCFTDGTEKGAKHPKEQSAISNRPKITALKSEKKGAEYPKEQSKEQKSETVNVTLRKIDRPTWEVFQYLCEVRDGKKPEQKLLEMIKEFNRQKI